MHKAELTHLSEILTEKWLGVYRIDLNKKLRTQWIFCTLHSRLNNLKPSLRFLCPDHNLIVDSKSPNGEKIRNTYVAVTVICSEAGINLEHNRKDMLMLSKLHLFLYLF